MKQETGNPKIGRKVATMYVLRLDITVVPLLYMHMHFYKVICSKGPYYTFSMYFIQKIQHLENIYKTKHFLWQRPH